jgi:HD-GYP domain-containing protein (c-di-GMP phosphodiesterase class II)
MSDPNAINELSSRSIFEAMQRRCAELGLPLWHCDSEGRVLVEPEQPEPVRQWLHSTEISAAIESATRALCQQPNPIKSEPIEIEPGRWLVAAEDRKGSQRMALNVALVLSDEAANAPAEATRFSRSEIPRIATFLRWSAADVCRAERDARTIEQFSEKLAQAYEETSVLYRMARLLNGVSEPSESIGTIGTQLQQILPFGWLAIRFCDESHGVRDLAGRLIMAGTPPCDAQIIRASSDPLLERAPDGKWRKILKPGQDDIATATGAEVLAEPIKHDGRVIGLLMAGNKRGPDAELSSFETQFLDATADFLGVFHENLARFAEQQEMFLGILRALTASIDAKDRYTRGHSERVGLMASKMAAALGLEKQLVEQYRTAGIVHDVGKIGVPEAVLTKPGRLTEEEFAQIKLHPEIGYKILKDIPVLAPVLPGVLWHHERWDGRGYPSQLGGEDIPLIARVLALADTFDAMSSNRSYRPALSRPKVLEEIRNSAGTQFDPSLAPLFISLDFADFDRALESHKHLEQKAA